ncbi:MAG TPA: DUF6445 family protein [Rudaea sp.]|nr:DUF6445 family protein [Rudaea sp.]
MAPLVRFTSKPRIERVALGDAHACYVIDDALCEPERLADFAAAQAHEFRNVDFNYYPGTYLIPPAEVGAALGDFFAQHVRRLFDSRRIVDLHCRLSIVTLAPEALKPGQWICHRDSAYVPPERSIQASVLYLFRDSSLGGTSFYEPLLPPQEAARLLHDSTTLDAAAFAQKYTIERGYMCGSNAYFRCIGSVPAAWNRLIFYDGGILHSGDIGAPHKLSADPRAGRLTLNGFFTSRRRAV